MNMISTGAFLNEMNTSDKQETVSEKFARVWEKKNSNAARAGGVSLMALSLAACGGSSSTTTTTTTTDTTTDTTTVAGSVFALTSSADVLAPNATAAANKTTAGDDTFRAGANGDLTSSDLIDGGAGTDTLTASVTEGAATAAVTVKPALTSVENVTVTMTAISADSTTTFNLTDSTGVDTLRIVNANDADVTVVGTTDTAVTFAGVAGTAMDSVLTLTLNGLTTATTANGGGEDAYTVTLDQLDAASLTLAGVETVTLNLAGKAVDVDAVDMDGLETLIITGGVNDASITTEVAAIGTSAGTANSAFDFEGLDTGETAVINASASTGAVSLVVDDSVDLTATGGAGKLTLDNTSAGATGVTNTAEVTVTAGAGGVDLTLEGGVNTSTTAMNKITVTGSDVADTVNVTSAGAPVDNSSTTALENTLANVILNTGAGNDVLSADIGNLSIDAGAGNDKLTMSGISATELNSYDTIDMGAGEDIVSTDDATLDTNDDAQLDRISNAEVLETTAVGDKEIDLTAISSFTTARIDAHTAQFVGDSTTSGGTDGADGVDFTTDNSNNRIIIDDIALVGEIGSNARTGSTAADSGGDGGIGLDVGVSVDNGANTLTIDMIDAASITGGAGGGDSSASGTSGGSTGSGFGGDGGMGVAAETIDVLNIVLTENDGVEDTVTFAGGAAGGGSGASGGTASDVGITVATNATINVSDAVGSGSSASAAKFSNLDFNTIGGSNVTVNAQIQGDVTINATSGNVTINTGSGADTISTGTGVDIISAGAGDDTIDAQTGADDITGGTGNDSFVINVGDSAEATYKQITDFTLLGGSWTGTSAIDTVAEFQSSNAGGTSVDADILDLDHTTAITIEADTTVAQASAASTANVTYSVSNGIVTLAGTGASAIDTLGEWVDEVQAIVTAAHQVAAFELSGNTYVYMEDGTDAVIELTGVTGVEGLTVVAGSGTIGGENYIAIM